jgi:hypothetical protein
MSNRLRSFIVLAALFSKATDEQTQPTISFCLTVALKWC